MKTINLDKEEVLWLDLMVYKMIKDSEKDLKLFTNKADEGFYNSTIADIKKLKTLREKILFDDDKYN